MRDFEELFAMAAARKGGAAALEAILATTRPRAADEVARIPDDRVLSQMSRRVFHAGFNWDVVDAKWEAFEVAFDRFDPRVCAFLSEPRFDALLQDKSLIRNGAKLRSVIANAGFVLGLAERHGGAARFFAEWRSSEYVGLLQYLKDHASHFGGRSAMWFLRGLGLPAFVLTEGVVAALIREGVVTKAPTGKADMAAVQRAFNNWAEASGRDLTAISRVLAMSIGENREVEPGYAPGR